MSDRSSKQSDQKTINTQKIDSIPTNQSFGIEIHITLIMACLAHFFFQIQIWEGLFLVERMFTKTYYENSRLWALHPPIFWVYFLS